LPGTPPRFAAEVYRPVVDLVTVRVIVCGRAGTTGTIVSVVSSSTSSLFRTQRRCELAAGGATSCVVVVIIGEGVGNGVVVVICSVDTVRVTGGGIGVHAAAVRQAVSITPAINLTLDLISIIGWLRNVICRPDIMQ
jgi:hypothetical protein